MICAHCSSPVADEARFCHSCGSLVSDAEGQAAATAAMDQSSFGNMERLLREDTKGEYIVGHMLGRGGMAVVYLATETQLSRKVALKVLPPELTFGHGVERFKREAKTAAALDHPNIIPIYRIASSGKLFWYAMKYLEGKSLEDMLRERGSFPLDETIDILEQVADALDYAHEHQVIHRDIKPANVMLDNRDRVVVTDFGIAKALTEGKLTATDSVIGTPYFMSPEQGMGKTVTGRSDQYSVGVMAYRMLAGHVPFDGDSAIDILHKHCMFPAPSLHDDLPDVPQHVSDAIAKALSKAGDDRFATVHDLVQSMKDANYVPKAAARSSSATVIMNSADAKKARSGPGTSPVAGTGKGRTVVQSKGTADKAIPKTVAARATAPAPAKSRTGLVVGVVTLLIAAGSGGLYVMNRSAAGSQASPLTTLAPETPPAGAPSTPAVIAPRDTTPTVVDAGTVSAPPTTAPSTVTRSPVTPGKTGPGSNTKRPPATQTANAPQPVQSPAATNPSVPANSAANSAANSPAPSPAPSAPAASNAGLATLQIRFSPPANVSLDGRGMGEKAGLNEQLVPGTHQLRVAKDGFITKDTTFTVTAGETTRLSIRLEPRP